jgi:hypothetical protein
VVWEAGCGRLWFKVGMNNGTCLRTLLLERSKLYILMLQLFGSKDLSQGGLEKLSVIMMMMMMMIAHFDMFLYFLS